MKTGRPKRKKNAPAAQESSEHISYTSLLKVKEIVDELGGIDEARRALSALERLMS